MRIYKNQLDKQELEIAESLLFNGNGHIGVRNTLEENDYSSFTSNRHTYLNGFYDTYSISYPEQYFGATKAGLEPVNIISQQFRDVFLIAGGTGFTLSLLLAIFVGAESKTLRSVAKISAPAALFNINEPIIFGLPIVLNPIMAIPFIITPLVLCVITYVAIATGLVPPTNGVAIPWTTPIFISGFLTTGIRGVLLQGVNLAVAFCMYFPFIKVLDKQYLAEEAEAEANQ